MAVMVHLIAAGLKEQKLTNSPSDRSKWKENLSHIRNRWREGSSPSHHSSSHGNLSDGIIITGNNKAVTVIMGVELVMGEEDFKDGVFG